MTVLGSADASKDMRHGAWRPRPQLGDTVTVDGAFVSLEWAGPGLGDWPLGKAAALELDSLDE